MDPSEALGHSAPVSQSLGGESLAGGTSMTETDRGPPNMPGACVVPSAEYPTVQSAVDALPEGGGTIWLAESVAETGILLDKPIKLIGQGAASGANPVGAIDTSGGDGIHVAAAGVTIRDVQITGDGTGGDGLRFAGTETARFGGRTTVENVTVEEKGGHGAVFDGGQLNNKFDLSVWRCGGDGFHFRGDWFNENTFDRMTAVRCDGDGVYIGQTMDPGPHGHQVSRFTGNTVQQFWMEKNDGWGLHVEEGVRFEGNHLTGYGIEHNQDAPSDPAAEHTDTASAHNKVIKAVDLGCPDWRKGGSGNTLHVKNIHTGTIELDRTEFETLVATNVMDETGRIEMLYR